MMSPNPKPGSAKSKVPKSSGTYPKAKLSGKAPSAAKPKTMPASKLVID